MKKTIILFLIFGTAFFASCASPEIRPSKQADRHAALPFVAAAKVPLPERTPYDSNCELKARYLEGYATGYRIGITGCAASCDIAGSKDHPERARAYIEGNFAGQDAGQIACKARDELNP